MRVNKTSPFNILHRTVQKAEGNIVLLQKQIVSCFERLYEIYRYIKSVAYHTFQNISVTLGNNYISSFTVFHHLQLCTCWYEKSIWTLTILTEAKVKVAACSLCLSYQPSDSSFCGINGVGRTKKHVRDYLNITFNFPQKYEFTSL